MATPSVCCVRVRIFFAVIGVLVGISIFAVFGAVYNNWDAAAWGLISGILAAITLAVHLTYSANGCRQFSHRLRPLMLFGCCAQLAGVCAFAVYLALAIQGHQGLTPYGRGYYLAAVWSAMTWKWAFLLFYYSRSYKQAFELATGSSASNKYENI